MVLFPGCGISSYLFRIVTVFGFKLLICKFHHLNLLSEFKVQTFPGYSSYLKSVVLCMIQQVHIHPMTTITINTNIRPAAIPNPIA